MYTCSPPKRTLPSTPVSAHNYASAALARSQSVGYNLAVDVVRYLFDDADGDVLDQVGVELRERSENLVWAIPLVSSRSMKTVPPGKTLDTRFLFFFQRTLVIGGSGPS